MSKVTPTSHRKSDHIRINLEEDVETSVVTGLAQIRFVHEAVPELDYNDIKSSTSFLGKQLDSPLLISSMTGGTSDAGRINQRLAAAAQSQRIALGVGSMRAVIEDPNLASSFDIRKTAPDILLFANLGAVQLNYGYDIDECRRAVEMIGADALILHFNPLQEALQPEGDTNFAGLLKRIETLSKKMEVPLIAKEVGWGISGESAQKLINAGIQVIDVAGAGGTSWSQVEMHRATTPEDATTASVFRDWGIPTATAIQEVRNTLPEVPLIASGGIRNGVEIAKCIALGADIVGMAGPFLKAATEDADHVERIIVRVTKEIRVAMFATGSRDLKALRKAKFRALS